jgi:hypothetical protein
MCYSAWQMDTFENLHHGAIYAGDTFYSSGFKGTAQHILVSKVLHLSTTGRHK